MRRKSGGGRGVEQKKDEDPNGPKVPIQIFKCGTGNQLVLPLGFDSVNVENQRGSAPDDDLQQQRPVPLPSAAVAYILAPQQQPSISCTAAAAHPVLCDSGFSRRLHQQLLLRSPSTAAACLSTSPHVHNNPPRVIAIL